MLEITVANNEILSFYRLLKDFQPLVATGVALIAAYVSFVAPVRAALVNATTSREIKDKEIEEQRRIAAEVLETKSTAFVAWMAVRCNEAVVEVRKLEHLLDVYEEVSKEESKKFPETEFEKTLSMKREITNFATYYDYSQLAAATLEILLILHREDVRLYSAILWAVGNVDRALKRFNQRPIDLTAMARHVREKKEANDIAFLRMSIDQVNRANAAVIRRARALKVFDTKNPSEAQITDKST